MKKKREKLANGNTVEERFFDFDESCSSCGYTIFAAGKRYVEIDADDEEKHYHAGCYAPLYAMTGEANEELGEA